MSELKAYRVKGVTLGDTHDVYIKEDADKVIAELKEKIKDMDVTHTVHIAKMNALIEELEESQRWRKFSEEKPPHDTWCLVYHEGEIDADHYTDDCNNHDRFVMYGYYVTHWMPMPKAPKNL